MAFAIDIPPLSLVLSALLVVVLAYGVRLSLQPPFPPGPASRFFTGNIHQIPRQDTWKTYLKWAKQYGPIFLLRLFNRKVIVLNTHTAVMDLLESRSANYSERPASWMFKELVGRKWSVFNISASNPRFKAYRRLLHSALDHKAVQSYFPLLSRHNILLLRSIHAQPDAYITHIRRNSGGIILELAYGRTVDSDADDFVRVVEESFKLQAELMRPGRWLVDIFPMLRFMPPWLPGASFKLQAEKYKEEFRRLDRIPHEWAMKQIRSGSHIPSFTSRYMRPVDGNTPDGEREDIIKWCSAALYVGGADTTVSTMASFFLLMTLNPEAQRQAQEEIDRVVGTERFPNIEDREKLPYVNALIKEVLRRAPVAPLGIAHAALNDDTYQGFLIPKGSSIVANIWALLHDPAVYPEPLKFDPGRFVGDASSVQYDSSHYAFGFGRRACIGLHFAKVSLFLNIASVLAAFSILKPLDDKGVEYDPPFEFISAITAHPKPFRCRIIARPHAVELLQSLE
ncbi:cytochrome P450 [Vararia minispora EC-137]|uniref:Cytochrome P450 n=1 Tax=Vararia minispora EC-137 TaxID=1314806 RepID=A0ACB8Q805_9AGAM|nr:cytochrome P450 [Vararia minispora EC-137]